MEFQPVKVATGSEDEEGRLVFHDGKLVAVMVRLDDPNHGASVGQWTIEAGFDGVDSTEPPLFSTLDVAEVWISRQVSAFKSV